MFLDGVYIDDIICKLFLNREVVLYVGLSIDCTLCEADNHLEIIKMVFKDIGTRKSN